MRSDAPAYWNYRVVTGVRDGQRFFKVVEVYYNEKDEPDGWCDCTDTILEWDNYEDLKGTAHRVLGAFDKPVLEIAEGDRLVEYAPSPTTKEEGGGDGC